MSSHITTGYGPSYRLCFDGDEEGYELWEVKFMAHLRLQNLHDVMEEDADLNAEDVAAFHEKNSRVFAELVQRLDDKSLSLIIREARDDGRKAVDILRGHYLGKSHPRIISLYTELTSLRKEEETVTSYIIRIEKTVSSLQKAGEELSEGLLVAMALKGLPDSYSAFATVITQKESIVTFADFKTALKAYEENEKSRKKDDKILNVTDNKNIKCFKCGKFGHKKFQCRSNENGGENSRFNNRWCNVCKNSTHDTKFCRKVKSSSSAKLARERGCVSEQRSAHDNNFAMKAELCTDSVYRCNNTSMLLVDTGATSHIITDKHKFINFDKSFDPSSHFIELADGSRNNNVVVGKGDANVVMTDRLGNEHNVTLKNALCIPSFSQDILSVHAATQQGVSVSFSKECADLKTKNGTVFDIDKKGKLYFVNKMSSNNKMSRTLKEWHEILGHCNKDDVIKLSNVVDQMIVTDRDNFFCDVCVKGKFTQYRNRYPDLKAKNILDLVHCDIAGPIDPVANGNFKYAINFVDDHSGYIYVYLLKVKSDATVALKQFLADTAPYGKVKSIRTDNALEFTGKDFESILRERGVKHEFSAPYSAHQNGTAERAWRSLFEMTRCLIMDANVPKSFWSYGVKCAAYIRNRCYNNRTGLTPYEVLTSKKPNLSNMNKFGTKCFAYVQEKSKLDDRAEEGIFLGYDSVSPAYFVYFPKKSKISKVRMVKFNTTSNQNLNSYEHYDDELEYYVPSKQRKEPTTEDQDNPEVEEKDEEISQEENQDATNDDSRRYPRRERRVPPHLEDYVKYSVDYCYKMTDIPDTYKEAIKSHSSGAWKTAMNEEMTALTESDTYDLMTLPDGRKPIGSRWVYAVKLGENDEEKYKARLVAKGYSQVQGIDYAETFSPTAKITSIRMMMQIAAQNNYYVNQMDVKSAYLNAKVEEEIYLDPPEGYKQIDKEGNKLVWKLKKSLYGLKQSGRNWNEMFHSFLVAEGFKQSLSDSCFYIKTRDKSVINVIIWVDDVLISSNNLQALNEFKINLSNTFRMKDLGSLSYFLGIKFDLKAHCIKMNQSKHISKILDRFQMNNCFPKYSPCDVNVTNFDFPDSKLCDIKLYQEIVGSLIYVMSCTRPDICYIVSKLSQYMHKPTNAHLQLAKNVLKYLKATIDYSLTFTKSDNFSLVGYCDSDWGSSSDRKSISGQCFQMNKNGPLISWRSKKQNIVALSSCEAEYIAMTSAVQEAKFLSMLLSDMNIKLVNPVKLYVDNQGAIALAKNPVHHQRTKHIDIRYHFIRSEIANNNVDIQYVPSNENLADLFTKPVSRNKIKSFVKSFGLEL